MGKKNVSTYRVLRPVLAARWRSLSVAVASTAVVAAADLARPFPLALIVDRILDGREAPFTLGEGDISLLYWVGGLVLAIALADAVGSYNMDVSLQRAGEHIVQDLRTRLYDQLQRLSLVFHDRRQAGELVTGVTGDVTAVGSLFSDSIGLVVTSVLFLIGMAVVTFLQDPVLALIAFSVTPVLTFLSLRFTGKLRVLAREQRAKDGEIASLATEALSAMRVVKSLGSERYEHARLGSKSSQRMVAAIKSARLEGSFAGLVDVLGAVGTAAVLVVGVFRVAQGHLSPGELIIMASYVKRVYKPLRDITKQANRIARVRVRADRVAEILTAEETLEDRPGAFHHGRAAGSIELSDVGFAYDPARPVLKNASLSIAAGEKVAIMGRSGAGKSTVAALMARFYDPTSGRVLLDGRDVRDCALVWLRAQVAVLLQDTVLFTGSVADNIAYGIEASEEDIESAARAAGAHEFISALPEAYDTQLGPRGVALSGGQRQRISIARTLLRDPPVLILDEPTTGLDELSEKEVLKGLDELMKGRTTIIVTHSPALARSAGRLLIVEDGRVAEASGDGPDERRQPTSERGPDDLPDDALPYLESL